MKKLYLLTLILIAFLSGIMTTCFATYDASFERSLESRKNYEAACIYKGIIKTFIENYESLAKDDYNGDWQLHANNLDELYYEFINNAECNPNTIITPKELENNYNNKELW